MSQPVKIGEKRPNPPQERDIVFIVDTSVSMILRDYILDGQRISRMNLLKGVLDNFIQELNGERMSIIVFGDNAYTLVPLTSDQHLLRTMLSRVQATMAGRFNAMGAAISLAVKQAISQQDQSNKANTRKRVLVLLTDADQPTGDIDPITATQLAKAHNLPLYTIAIGSTSINSEEKRQGGLLYSPVDLDLVKRISKTTGAKYFQAGDPNALDDAIAAINQHETNTREIEPLYFKEPLYFWFLIAASVLFISQQILILLISTFNLSNKGKV
ncbi:MAG: VWA domain-containing protein [Woeseiaceae bacterium]